MVIYRKQWGACIWGEDGSRGTGECSTGYGHKRWAAHKIKCDRSYSPFCRHNRPYVSEGAANAEELVKGDWPELRVLDIRWGGPAMLHC
jgi:hypothetical protein